MALKGPLEGEDYGLYRAATAFFAARSVPQSGTPSISAEPVPRTPSKSEAAAAFADLCASLEDVELPPGQDEEEEEKLDPMSCDVVRRRITEFIGAHGISQAALLTHLRVNSNSYGRFMAQRGPLGGSGNNTYWSARRFFTKVGV